MNLPNTITLARIGIAPLLAVLILAESFWARLLAFGLFVVAAASDVWDGHLARRRGQITDFGKLVDPIADKFLLAGTLVPFYLLPRIGHPVGAVPHWGPLPLWVVLVLLGREVVITLLRGYAVRRGVVIGARKAGKYKTAFQNLFIGGLILWYALETRARETGWAGEVWPLWSGFHGAFVSATLILAIVLSVYSLGLYVWQYRRLVRGVVV